MKEVPKTALMTTYITLAGSGVTAVDWLMKTGEATRTVIPHGSPPVHTNPVLKKNA